jgi:hypothetical protein
MRDSGSDLRFGIPHYLPLMQARFKSYKVDDTIWNTAGGVKAANLLLDDLEKHLLNK